MRRFFTIAAAALLLAGPIGVASGQTDSWEFSDASRIALDGTSGDVRILPSDGSGIVIEVEADVRPADSFEPQVEQRGDRIFMDEDWSGRRSRGRVEWTIHLPKGGDPIEIRVDTASGSLRCEDVTLDISFETASGDVELFNVELAERSEFDTASGSFQLAEMTIPADCDFNTASGDIHLDRVMIEEGTRFNTASGDVEARECQGYFDLSSASGDVDVRNCVIEGEAEFSTASGDVMLAIERLPAEGLVARSASGNVALDVADLSGDYRIVMIKREDRGRIRCPFEFTSERTFRDGRHTYEEKTVEKGSGGPEIELRTASGRVTLDG